MSKKILIATNSIDYNNVISSLNKSLESKVFLSYYTIIKYQLELENRSVLFLPKYEHLLSKN